MLNITLQLQDIYGYVRNAIITYCNLDGHLVIDEILDLSTNEFLSVGDFSFDANQQIINACQNHQP